MDDDVVEISGDPFILGRTAGENGLGKRIRLDASLTLDQAAELAGLSRTTYHAFERGQRQPFRKAGQWGAALHEMAATANRRYEQEYRPPSS